MKKKSRSSKEKIRELLKQAEEGAKLESLHEQGDATLTKGRAKANGLDPAVAKRLQHLEEENRRLRSLVADLTLSNQALKLAVSKKW